MNTEKKNLLQTKYTKDKDDFLKYSVKVGSISAPERNDDKLNLSQV